ncbi:MAG: DsbA family oxidoreductase [Spirochaetota bacterium]
MHGAIKIDIWSDLVCPWCYIGKRRLEEGMKDFAGREESVPIDIEWHSYELSPDTPLDIPKAETEVSYLVRHKGLSETKAREMLARVTDIATSVGLTYDFDTVKPANTVKAHQLLHHARAKGFQAEAKERLFSAHFTEGRDLGNDDILAELASEVGLDRDEFLLALREERHLAAVRADQEQARAFGITGVPFFVIDGRYAISGAQSAETFTGALLKVVAERGEAGESAPR